MVAQRYLWRERHFEKVIAAVGALVIDPIHERLEREVYIVIEVNLRPGACRGRARLGLFRFFALAVLLPV